MRKLSILAFLVAFTLFITPQLSQAQTAVEVGPRIGIDVGDIEEFFIGAEGRIVSDALPVIISPAFDFYFVGSEVEGVDQSIFTIDVNALYEFGVDNEAFTPYAGGGLGLVRSSVESQGTDIPGVGTVGGGSESSTDVGLNVVGGAIIQTETLRPFVQAKITFSDDFTLFGLMGGLLFSF